MPPAAAHGRGSDQSLSLYFLLLSPSFTSFSSLSSSPAEFLSPVSMFGSDQHLNERAIYTDWQNETPAKLDRTSVSGWVLFTENERREGRSFLVRRWPGGRHPETGQLDSERFRLSRDSCGLDSRCRFLPLAAWCLGMSRSWSISKRGIRHLFITYEAHEFLLMLRRRKMLFREDYGKGAFLNSLSMHLISSEHSPWCCLNSLYPLKEVLQGNASGAIL